MSREEPVEAIEQFRCANCGAPLDVSPETIVAVCSYCGYPNWLREELKEELFIVNALPESKILAKARERAEHDRDLKKIVNNIEFGKPLQVYVPFYFADATAKADYAGRVQVFIEKCRKEGKETRCWTEYVIVNVSGIYGPLREVHSIVGRRGVRAFSIRVLGKHYIDTKPQPQPLSQVRLERKKTRRILSVEINKDEALRIALDNHLDLLRDKVTEKIKKDAETKARFMAGSGTITGSRILWKRIRPFDVDVKISPIILLPLYIVPYRYSGTTYRFFMSGWDGETIVAEEPMNMMTRIIWGAAASIIAGVTGGIAGITAMLGESGLIIIGGIIGVLGAGASYYAIRMATRPVRVEVVGERFKTLKEFGKKLSKFAKYTDMAMSDLSIVGDLLKNMR